MQYHSELTVWVQSASSLKHNNHFRFRNSLERYTLHRAYTGLFQKVLLSADFLSILQRDETRREGRELIRED